METTYLSKCSDRELANARANSRRLIELGHSIENNRQLVAKITALLDARKAAK